MLPMAGARNAAFAILVVCGSQPVRGQSTSGAITGRAYRSDTHAPVSGVPILCRKQATGEMWRTRSDGLGYYAFPRLSPGTYWLRAGLESDADGLPVATPKPDYQPRETFGLELYVAGRVVLDIPLRDAADIYGQRYIASFLPSSDAIVHTYTADFGSIVSQPLSLLLGSAGTLYSTLSYVIDARQLQALPLAGRDVYTALVLLPGVTADNATARGLGISVNGQRSFSSNFLLDGVENNDYLLSGPLNVIAPEAVEEYRVSTNNFSAEYGATAGFVANAITRSGGNRLHGVLYGYLNDTVLNANSYQHKAGLNTSTNVRATTTVPRQPGTDFHLGFWSGGAIRRDRTFWSAAYERFRSRQEGDEFPFQVPVLASFQGGDPVTLQILRQHPPPVPAGGTGPGLSTTYVSRIPVEFDRHLGLVRLDEIAGQNQQHRWMARGFVSRNAEPYFGFNIYPGLSSALHSDSVGAAVSHNWVLSPSANNELRLGYRNHSQGWNRPGGPGLFTTADGATQYAYSISLPASPLISSFDYRGNSGEISDTLALNRGRWYHSFGGGVLINRSAQSLPWDSAGHYSFSDLGAFKTGLPDYFETAVTRRGLALSPDDLDFRRDYSNHQFYGFYQGTVRIGRSAGVNFGVRYESFGAPRNLGVQDAYLQPGTGSTIEQRVASAQLLRNDSERRSVYTPDRNNWAGRAGVFYDLTGRGQTVLRAAYGIFYDRPFDTLTSTQISNNFQLGYSFTPVYATSGTSGTAGFLKSPTPALTWIDQGLRTPYVQSWFAGIQHQPGRDLYVEVSGQGALGRKLIAADVINRNGIQGGRLNRILNTDIVYRSNVGSSVYTALTALVRYGARRSRLQAAYTWGHSIDNQSDPLQGAFGDLQLTSSNVGIADNRAAFSRQFDSRLDRGSSDFDQRQNLVIYGIQEIGPAARAGWRGHVLAGWQAAGMAGFRSGFPFNIIATSSLQSCPGSTAGSDYTIIRNRPSLVPGRNPFLANRVPLPGGYGLMDVNAFCDPGPYHVGMLGRNVFTGPGFWNADLSVAKAFAVPRFGEGAVLQFRADVFNAFNHANLGVPYGLAARPSAPNCRNLTPCPLAAPVFGESYLGRQGVQPSFPSNSPLDQLARQVQLQLKLIF